MMVIKLGVFSLTKSGTMVLIQITRKWDIGSLIKSFKAFFDKKETKGCIMDV